VAAPQDEVVRNLLPSS